MKFNEPKKCKFFLDMLRLLVPSFINWSTHLSYRNLRIRNCVVSTAVIWNNINLILERSGQQEIINEFATRSRQNMWVRFPHCSQSTSKSSTASYLEHICRAHIGFGICSNTRHTFQDLVSTPYQGKRTKPVLFCWVSVEPRSKNDLVVVSY